STGWRWSSPVAACSGTEPGRRDAAPAREASVAWRVARRERLDRALVDDSWGRLARGRRLRRAGEAGRNHGRAFAPGTQLPEHVLEDAAVAVVLGLLGRVDAHERAELGRAAVLLPGPHRHAARLALGPERRLDTLDLVELTAREPQRLRALARLELERQHPHAHQVGAVDPLEALRQHRAHA